MKTNNELIKEIESGKNPFDVIAQERKEVCDKDCVNSTAHMKDAYWIGALESKFTFSLQEIIKLRKENERLNRENFDLYAESKREDLAQEATYENVTINGEGEE